jgi:glycosyltransferase involved in cell wall biosynthesis
MRIVQLVTRRQWRGAEVLAAQIADGMVERGHNALLVGIYPPAGEPLVTQAAPTADLVTTSSGKLSRTRINELARLLKSAQPDIVQANTSDTLKYSVFAKRKLRAGWPLVYRNASVASQWLRFPGHRLWGRWLIGHVDHVAAVSPHSRQDFLKTYKLPPARISVIPTGIPIPESLDPVRARARLAQTAGVTQSGCLLVHVASFTPEKNHLWLIDAFEQVRSFEPSAQLVLIGDGPLRRAAEEAIAGKGMQSAVHFLGSRPDAAQLMAGADLALLPSTVEGIPGVILEAAAHAVPSVATNVGSVAEAVDNGRTGVLVTPGDQTQFVSAIIDLLRNSEERMRMGQAARDFVRKRFDLNAVVDAFEALYNKVITTQAISIESRLSIAATAPPA